MTIKLSEAARLFNSMQDRIDMLNTQIATQMRISLDAQQAMHTVLNETQR